MCNKLASGDQLAGYCNTPSERRWVLGLGLCQWGWKEEFAPRSILQVEFKLRWKAGYGGESKRGWLPGFGLRKILYSESLPPGLPIPPIAPGRLDGQRSSWESWREGVGGASRWTESSSHHHCPPPPPYTQHHTDSWTAPHALTRESETHAFLISAFGKKNTHWHSPPFLPANEQQKCLQHKEKISNFFHFARLRVEFPLLEEIPPTLD